MPNVPIIGIIFLVLLVLPIKLDPKQLKMLAFVLWLTGGSVLTYLGFVRLADPSVSAGLTPLMAMIIAAVVIGALKGKFVLSKSSQKNLERLQTMQEPQKPIHVYSTRSWIVIGIMILISLSLTWFHAPMLWRGLVNIAIGFALITSSFTYIRPETAKLTASAQ